MNRQIPRGVSLLDPHSVMLVVQYYRDDAKTMKDCQRGAHAMFEQGLISDEQHVWIYVQAQRALDKIRSNKVVRFVFGGNPIPVR